jgi:hypothetical protein
VDDINLDILKEQCDDAFYFPLLCGCCQYLSADGTYQLQQISYGLIEPVESPTYCSSEIR